MRSETLSVRTGGTEVVRDLTSDCASFVQDAGDGLLHVFVPHATAGLAILETGAGSDDDLLTALADLLPADDRWQHRHGSRGHGRSHVMPALTRHRGSAGGGGGAQGLTSANGASRRQRFLTPRLARGTVRDTERLWCGKAGPSPALTRNRGSSWWCESATGTTSRSTCCGPSAPHMSSVVEYGPELEPGGSFCRPASHAPDRRKERVHMFHLEVASGSQPRSARPAARAVLMLALAAVLGVALPSLLAPAGTAHAASYRFWGYYQLTGSSWAFAQKGPADTTPKDGAVEGWRFAVSDETTPRFPRATPTFAALCGGTAAKAGSKRVGVVIDSGRPADADGGATPPAPQAACAVVDTKASGAEVLATVASVRVDKGLTCAVNGYPATGCGAEVKQVPAAAKAADTPVTIPAGAAASPSASPDAAQPGNPATSAAAQDSGVSAATWAGIVIVLALVAVVAFVALRRRRRA